MNIDTLKRAMGGDANYGALLAPMVNAMRMANINNVRRAAMWCAQIGHESVGLRYMEEIADGSAYNGRADLGNVHPGDGPRYKGRGPIQLTGRHNYGAFSGWCHSKGWVDSPTYFVDHPEKVGEPHWGFLAAAYYWTVSRPQLNALADRGDLEGCTRAINGGTNGITDRRARYQRCLALGDKLLPTGGQPVVEKRLEYSRTNVHQDTYYWCGPASAQTVILSATGKLIPETTLATELGTTVNGTNDIQNILPSLNRHIPDRKYVAVRMPNDPPLKEQVERLWDHLVRSINAGAGIVANIWAPPSNYPRPSYTSTSPLQYSGGFVMHYVAFMGYAVDSAGGRHVWWADSGFAPYGCWVSLDQTATLVPPRSYAWPSASPESKVEESASETPKENNVSNFGPEQSAALHEAKTDARAVREQMAGMQRQLDEQGVVLSLILDQLVGPERDEHGFPRFTGWPADDQWPGTRGVPFVQAAMEALYPNEEG